MEEGQVARLEARIVAEECCGCDCRCGLCLCVAIVVVVVVCVVCVLVCVESIGKRLISMT